MQPGWCQPVRQEFMENECEALPGVAYPGVRDNRSALNTKTGYDEFVDADIKPYSNRAVGSCVYRTTTVIYSLGHGLCTPFLQCVGQLSLLPSVGW